MSSSINDIGKRFTYSAIPLALILTSGAAIWLGAIHSESQFRNPPLHLPEFHFQSSEHTVMAEPQTTPAMEQRSFHVRQEAHNNIFGSEVVAKQEDRNLETMELSLGLIVIKGKNRFCLTNGVMLAEGASVNGFQVQRIEENRVWYKIADSFCSLQPGERKNIDMEGKVIE